MHLQIRMQAEITPVRFSTYFFGMINEPNVMVSVSADAAVMPPETLQDRMQSCGYTLCSISFTYR